MTEAASGPETSSEPQASSQVTPPPPTTEPEISVTSSLEGREELPRRLRWDVTTSLPAGQVQEVRFLIDDRLRWIDRQPPYRYAGDNGYLVTSWLVSSEPVHFTAEVVGIDGSTGSATVAAGVPDRGLEQLPYGIWGRLGPDALSKPLAERWGEWTAEMHVAAYGEVWIGRSFKEAYMFDASGTDRTLRILAPIRKVPRGESFSEYGWRFAGDLCGERSPFASYALTEVEIDGNNAFRLTATRDPCEARRKLMEGVWERID